MTTTDNTVLLNLLAALALANAFEAIKQNQTPTLAEVDNEDR